MFFITFLLNILNTGDSNYIGGSGGGGFGTGLGLLFGTGAGVSFGVGDVPLESALAGLAGTGLFLSNLVFVPVLLALHPVVIFNISIAARLNNAILLFIIFSAFFSVTLKPCFSLKVNVCVAAV
ncbi:hypothetical protein [Mucilaginibacter aquatilis]|uniref:hypothetical protein n=1 Tax=Mucilaginibacter aquatilis TaxID=1517760 RepID=UPI0018DC0678|nr:hypothetical protein [Mucilaginibacter aquatilis]